MGIHLQGAVEIPLEEFWPELNAQLRKDSRFDRFEDLFVAPKTLDFGGRGTQAEPGDFTGLVVRECDLNKSLVEIDPETAERFDLPLEFIWDLAGDYGVKTRRHEMAYGVPRLTSHDLFIPVVINSESARGNTFYVDRLRPEWEGRVDITSAEDYYLGL